MSSAWIHTPTRRPDAASPSTEPGRGAYTHPAMSAAFDTYTAAKRLRDAGFDEHQAEAAVSMVRDATAADRDQLATKADLAELRADTRADLAALEARLTWRLVGIAAAIVAAVKLIPGLD